MATTDQPVSAETPPTQQDNTAWYDLIGKWRAAVQNFQTNYQLVASPQDAAAAATDPDLQAKYQAVLADAQTVNQKIQDIDAALSDVQAWLSGAWDTVKGWWESVSGGVSQLFGYSPRVIPGRAVQLGGLGVVWLIPLSVVAAGIAYVAGKAMDLYQTHQQLAAVQTYVNQGYTPAQAAAAVAQAAPAGGLFSGISDTVKWVVGGTAAMALLWFFVIQPQMQKRRQ